jgi:hypothetical protein
MDPMTDTTEPLPLPPFSGDRPQCPKCGHKSARVVYLAYGKCRHTSYVGTGVVIGFQPNERLHRECDRCGFAWDEALADVYAGDAGS